MDYCVQLGFENIDGLFDKIPEHSWGVLLFRVNAFLEDCKRDFKLKDLDDVFYKAEARHEEFLAFVKSQNPPKPMYSPTVLDALSTTSPSTRKRAKCSKAKSAGGQVSSCCVALQTR